ncbi:hypothetical protein SDC9_122120 [bioreactor metagenome]|uniref:Uncharacterized protein n=1 Tax=bioreactor metagenome TaxID=1076179 RepID=A0A645CDV9_9ZZZZ
MHCLQAEKPLIFNHREKNNAIARYAGIEAIFMCNPNPDAYNAGNLTNRGSEAEKQYSFCIEFSRQHALKESEYELGKQSVRNVMTGIGMMEGEVVLARPVRMIAHDARSMRSDVTHTGHIRFHVNLFDRVNEGDKLYEVRDIQTVELLEEGFAAFDGVVTEISHYPIARPGIPVCRIAEGRLLAEAGEPLPKLPDHFFNH